MKLNRIIYGIVLFLLNFNLYSQEISKGGDYFFPIMPKEANYLSGTMGEIRSTHFHAGMDIKTSGRSGLPVYATLDGYVSRIKVSSGGYGHALYILHPNGETSVYGHLLRFREDIARYVLEQQYKKQSFEVDLFPGRDQFAVNRGDLVALSGNTGSSMGPHLHFEIRDKNQWPCNPLTKGYPEIHDDVSPSVYAFALKTLDIDSRIEDEFGRFEYKVKSTGDEYYVDKPLKVYGKIGLQLEAYDRLNGASNRNGIPYISVYLNDYKIFEVKIDSFSFSDTRHVVNYYDYSARKKNNGIFQKMYLDEGNSLPFYPVAINSGFIDIRDDQLYEVRVMLRDAYGNSSTFTLPLQGSMPSVHKALLKTNTPNQISTQLFEKYLKISAPVNNGTANHCMVYSNRMKYELLPSYSSDELAVYLWDMSLGLPDSVNVCDLTKSLNYEIMLPSGIDFNFYNKIFDIRSFRRSLYDTLFLEAEYVKVPDGGTEIFNIGNGIDALANPIQITFKPKNDYGNSEKFAVYSTADFNKFQFEGNEWKNNTITVTTKNLGGFTILEDTLSPTIKPLEVNRKKISFRIDDDLSGIKEYEAYLNGQWLLMHYDPKQKYIWSEALVPNNPLSGALKLTVKDNVGNINNYVTQIQ